MQVQKTGVGLPTRAPRWENGRGDAKTGAGIGWDREVRVALSAVAVADWDLVLLELPLTDSGQRYYSR